MWKPWANLACAVPGIMEAQREGGRVAGSGAGGVPGPVARGARHLDSIRGLFGNTRL